MKTNIKVLGISVFMVLAMFTSCQKDMLSSDTLNYAAVLDVSADGTSTVISQNMQAAFLETPDLTDAEIASLKKMKEEEKLARDVYSALNQKWNSPVFSRISSAENNHLGAIINLMKYYGESDTLVGETGIFNDVEVQTLYNDLLSQGSISLEEAYKTGALIEEMDIKDLRDAISITSNVNILMVYENLERGSRNHLRSFNNQLTALGVVYTPLYLSQSDYNQIVTSSMEKGKQYKMGGKGNGNCTNPGQGKRKGKN
ncbi:MAG: DUF2202 domain-containing protein [Bacteroidales bacterium]|nr:DUF2202 domain-containing protein [Bacteroidales bacterium]